MKKEIHPTYVPKAAIKCACGQVFHIGSTAKQMGVEICSQCHPFYIGREKLIDVAGRVEKFKARVKKAETTPQKPKKSLKPKTKTKTPVKTLKASPKKRQTRKP